MGCCVVIPAHPGEVHPEVAPRKLLQAGARVRLCFLVWRPSLSSGCRWTLGTTVPPPDHLEQSSKGPNGRTSVVHVVQRGRRISIPTDLSGRSELDYGASVEPDIRLDGVTKRFGESLAVDALDLEIPRGSFFALLGPSGCGKTTTLRMIGGFEDPTEGTVYLGGADVTDLPPYRRDVNTVFQSYALFPHLDVERNVAFGLERRKVPRAEITRRVGEVLELTQLTGFGKRRPAQLSGGQQQRVALARALVNRPAGAAAGRAARRARPQAPPPAPARAEADPEGGRDHLRARDARSGGGHEHGRRDRGHERRDGSSSAGLPPISTSTRPPLSSPGSSGSAT